MSAIIKTALTKKNIIIVASSVVVGVVTAVVAGRLADTVGPVVELAVAE